MTCHPQLTRLLDLDESGTIEENELKIGLSSIGCRPTQEELHGIITGINATEVFVKIDGGAKTRLYLKNLRNGRSRISLRDVDH